MENAATCVRRGEDQSLGRFKPRVHITVLHNNKRIGSFARLETTVSVLVMGVMKDKESVHHGGDHTLNI